MLESVFVVKARDYALIVVQFDRDEVRATFS
jgi:hypothetical protein